ncbi:TPA: P-type conjugative transfer protein TrbJ, partial [Pseudomonas aeruginosa]|nr:P-type conjugative transfer protein TrbJ [Pseudomonas aeruginosa]
MMTKPRLLSVSLAAVLSVSLLAVQPASALTVFDPSNFVQNTLTAVRTLEQINNQINQLQNEAQMLMNQARNLANLDFNIVNRLRSTLATTERLIAEARGLAYDVQSMD